MQPFLGEIKLFAGNFAPVNWLPCDGRLLSIADESALFSLLGTTYGGDGQSTFALPDFRGRVPVHMGTDQFAVNYVVGGTGGSEAVVVSSPQVADHTHAVNVGGAADNTGPGKGLLGVTPGPLHYVPGAGSSPLAFDGRSLAYAGQAQPHPNVMPSLVLTYIICTAGIFPSQS